MSKGEIVLCDPFTMGKIIDEPKEHVGRYISLEHGGKTNEFIIVACDNSDGDCWVETFDSITVALFWLNNKEMTAVEAHTVDECGKRAVKESWGANDA